MPIEHGDKINPLSLVRDASGVVLLVLIVLVAASFLVWVIWALKTLQLARMRTAQEKFEQAAAGLHSSRDLVNLALKDSAAPGARVVVELARRHGQPRLSAELLMSVAKRALVTERQSAERLMPTLSSIASASPFVGLFGTVWGIMEAFLKIGVAKSASLPVVAPAIGEALIATAVGLVAAIPATIAYNFIERKITDILGAVEASSETWVEVLASEVSSEALAGQQKRLGSGRMHVPAE